MYRKAARASAKAVQEAKREVDRASARVAALRRAVFQHVTSYLQRCRVRGQTPFDVAALVDRHFDSALIPSSGDDSFDDSESSADDEFDQRPGRGGPSRSRRSQQRRHTRRRRHDPTEALWGSLEDRFGVRRPPGADGDSDNLVSAIHLQRDAERHLASLEKKRRAAEWTVESAAAAEL
jgi:hypothetical protein